MIKKVLKGLASIIGHQHVDLSETQWWTLEELQELQELRLRKIVKYAYKNIPGYRKKFDQAGISRSNHWIISRKSLWPQDAWIITCIAAGKRKIGGIT